MKPLSPARRSPSPTALLVACAALALAALAGCARQADGEAAPAAGDGADGRQDDPVPVEVVSLESGPIESLLRYSVNVEAERQVAVLARAPGQVIGLLVEEGDEVREGQLLLRIEDDEARSALAKVENDLERAIREHDKQVQMHARGLVSDQTLENAAHERKRLEIALDDARRALRYTRVRAPIGGTISRRMVDLGDFLQTQQPLFEITDFDSLVARVHVPEAHLPALEVGLEARVRPQQGGFETYTGEIERIAPVIDADSGTVRTTIGLPSARGLRPGMFVAVELITERREEALRLPKRALVYDEEQPFAFLVVESDEGPRVERVRVDPVIEDRHFVLPKAGFSEGDRVVIAGQIGLKDGARVIARPAAQPPTATAQASDAGTGERVQ
jgi:membrane fusion protein, multidrug efflux system